MTVLLITEDWLPTPESVNALPEPLRKYIHDLEALCDPAGIVAENTFLRDQVAGVQALLVAERGSR